MKGFIQRLLGLGNHGASMEDEHAEAGKQEGFFTQKQQQLLVAQIQKQTQRQAVRILATKSLSPLALTTSKFGGLPYWKPWEPYPTDGSGKPCVLLAQFDCQQVPAFEGFPQTGLLQFFVSDDGDYGLDFDNQLSQENWRVVYHPEVDASVTDSMVAELGIPTTCTLEESSLPDRKSVV